MQHGVPRDKVKVLPIGVEVPDVPRTVTDGTLPFLFVGRFVPKKGIDVLADAARRLHAAGAPVRLLCVGDGPLRSTLEAVARDTGAVELTGWLPPAEVTRKMAGASALLVPSIVAPDGDAEGLPSVIPEAMAQAIPVIGSAEGGIAEAIEHGGPDSWSRREIRPRSRPRWHGWRRMPNCGMPSGRRLSLTCRRG